MEFILSLQDSLWGCCGTASPQKELWVWLTQSIATSTNHQCLWGVCMLHQLQWSRLPPVSSTPTSFEEFLCPENSRRKLFLCSSKYRDYICAYLGSTYETGGSFHPPSPSCTTTFLSGVSAQSSPLCPTILVSPILLLANFYFGCDQIVRKNIKILIV